MNKFFSLNCWLLNLFFFAKTFKSPLQHVYLFCKYNIISHYNFCNIKLLCIRIFWNTCGTSTGSHKDSVSMESRHGVEERDTVFVRGFYTAGTKTTPSFRDRIGASGSRNGTLDPNPVTMLQNALCAALIYMCAAWMPSWLLDQLPREVLVSHRGSQCSA